MNVTTSSLQFECVREHAAYQRGRSVSIFEYSASVCEHSAYQNSRNVYVSAMRIKDLESVCEHSAYQQGLNSRVSQLTSISSRVSQLIFDQL